MSDKKINDRASEILGNLSAVWVVEDRIEIAVRDIDIERDEAASFNKKFQQALAHRPGELTVRLQAKNLTTKSLGVLLRARADAVREGVRFVLAPESPAIARMVQTLGVHHIFGMAA